MNLNAVFFINCILLGTGLAMDAFSVSLANGLRSPGMGLKDMCRIAGCFGFFQTLMPLLGWFFVRSLAEAFSVFRAFIPWIALGLLVFLGARMILEGRGEMASGAPEDRLPGSGELLMQGVATSIDALSVGFTIASYEPAAALSASLLIGAVTFLICLAGIRLGRRFGMVLAGKASVLGGCILLFIGLEIFLRGML